MSLDELRRLVAENLSVEDQALWERVFATLGAEDSFGFGEFVAGDPENLKVLTENLKQKMAALTSLDPAAVAKILEEEKALITQ